MTLVTLVPNSTVSNTGSLAGSAGPATAHAALSDDSGNSWVALDSGEVAEVGFSDITLPAGAVMRDCHVYGRFAKSTLIAGQPTTMGLQNLFRSPPHYTFSNWSINFNAAQWHWGSHIPTGTTGQTTLSATQVNAATVRLYAYDGTAVVYEMWLRAYYVARPVVNITAPTGTLTDSTGPAVTWDATLDGDGGPQTHYEVTIRDAATDEIIAESGILGGEVISWAPTVPLPDDDYEATVRVAQTVNGARHWSATDVQAFTVDVPQPAVPTLTVTPEAGDGRTRIELEDPGGGAVSTDWFVVETSTDGGVTFEALRSTFGAGLILPSAGAATVYDYDAPNGALVYYRAHSVHWYVTAGVLTGSATSTYAKDADTWSSDDWWLKHPTLPSLNFTPVMKSQPGRSSSIAQGVFHPLGRRDPVVVSDVRQSFTGEAVIRCESDADRAALDALLADGTPLLLQAPAAAYWDDTWIAVAQHERTRAIDSEWSAYTFDSLAWTEVARPIDALEE